MLKRERIPWICLSVSMKLSRSIVDLCTRDLRQRASEPAHFFERIVVYERRPDCPNLFSNAQSLHQPRRIHVAIAHTDILFGEFFGDSCGGDIRQIEG